MAGSMLIFIELSLVFLLVLGWGFHELRSYRRYKDKQERKKVEASDGFLKPSDSGHE